MWTGRRRRSSRIVDSIVIKPSWHAKHKFFASQQLSKDDIESIPLLKVEGRRSRLL